MTEYSDHFNSRTVIEQHRKLELDDYNHAVADVDVGRMRKHIPEAATDPVTGKKETVTERIARTLQWLLINDPNYARAHRAAITATNDAMDATARTISSIKAALEQNTTDVESILNRAASLPDGRKVFRDGKGGVVDQDGERVEQDIAEGIIWQGDEPTYDEYRAEVGRQSALKRTRDEVLGIEAELGGHQSELSDYENPVSKDRIETIIERSEELKERVRDIQREVSQASENKSDLEVEAMENDISISSKSQTVLPTFGSGT